MKKAKSLELKLCGQRILIKASEIDPELSEQVMELVSRKIEEAEERTSSRTVAAHQVVLLALLDVAKEYIQAKQRTVEFKKKISAKSTHVLGLIEADRR
jgi:hypothetical protein